MDERLVVMSTLVTIIEQIALNKFRKASGDSGSMETHSIEDLIRADRYLSSKNLSTTNPLRAVKFAKAHPPGAIE